MLLGPQTHDISLSLSYPTPHTYTRMHNDKGVCVTEDIHAKVSALEQPQPGGVIVAVFLFSFFNTFLFFFSPPSPPVYSCMFFQLWVLLVVACGMPPRHGLMSSAMSALRIQTGETLGRRSEVHELKPLGHRASSWVYIIIYQFLYRLHHAHHQ